MAGALPCGKPPTQRAERSLLSKDYTASYIVIRLLDNNLATRSKVIAQLIGSIAALAIAVSLGVGLEQPAVSYGSAGTSHHGLNGGNAAGANGGNANGVNSSNGPGVNGGIANGGDSVNRPNSNATNTTRVHAPPSEVSFN